MALKSLLKKIAFDQNGLVPVVIQDAKTKAVLMVAYMNKKALAKTLASGRTHFWSRSRNKLWSKGEQSGHIQKVRGIFYDCDADTLLIKVSQTGSACHAGYCSCFYRQINLNTLQSKVIGKKMFDPKQVYQSKTRK
ncbi:phosphoribosyl-AMP cyclohydrolase [Candidatus Omnitrophota bacterium]